MVFLIEMSGFFVFFQHFFEDVTYRKGSINESWKGESRMLYLKSMLKVIDNSGALMAECIKVMGKSPKNYASVGDEIVCVIKKARPISAQITGASASNRVKKGDVVHAVVVRTKQPILRPDGSTIRFDDNACVLINKNSEPIGSRISSVVSRELKEKNFNKIVAMAPKAI